MYRVVVNGNVINAQEGQLLSEVLFDASKQIEHLCGGRGICRKCFVNVNGENVLSCRYIVNSDIVVSTEKKADIVSETGVEISDDITSENLGFVLDLGTTTLALALIALDNGNVVSVKTSANPQRIFGADVISRIDYCRNNGIQALKTVLVDEINRLINSFNVNKKLPLFVAGNMTMLHLLFGVDCTSIGVSPYTPAFIDSNVISGDCIGLNSITEVLSLPGISAFVGADIVAGINYVDMPPKEKFNILIDLGTNAEIVLFSQSGFICTSAAAGPCFEGANITCGMSACDGAIYSYSNGIAETINKSFPKGICATGLIDIIAYLLDENVIDNSGYMECEQFNISENVYINQEDIRQYQLAKSAVFSAVKMLLNIKKIDSDNIDKVYISGGFSSEFNVSAAIRTGLIPKGLADKCVSVNNSSLLGTIKFATQKNDLSQITENAEYIDLSLNKDFADLFIENMMF